MTRIVATVAAVLLSFAPGCKKGEKKRVEAAETANPAPTPTEPSGPPEGPKGTVKGVVHFTGKAPEMPMLPRGSDPVCAKDKMRAEVILVNDNATLANVLVRVAPKTVPGWVPSKPVEINQTKCMYRPRVTGGVVGQKLVIANSDQTAHNVHARDLALGKRQGTDTLWNRQQPPGMQPMESEIQDVDVIKLKCDQHAWMSGYVVVSDNGYFAVTGDTGHFEFQVPAGELTLQAWHEFYGVKETKVTVPEGGTAEVEFTYDATADDPTAASVQPPQ